MKLNEMQLRSEGEIVPEGWVVTVPLPLPTESGFPRIHVTYTEVREGRKFRVKVSLPNDIDRDTVDFSTMTWLVDDVFDGE